MPFRQTQTAPIPVIWRIDVEPDEFQPDARLPPWSGFIAMHDLVERLRGELEDMSGRSVHPTWFLRLDPAIEHWYGRADFVCHQYRRLVDSLRLRRDPFGTHVHFYRWNEERQVSFSDHADASWIAHCMDVAGGAYEQNFGERPRRTSQGSSFLSDLVVDCAAAAGIQVDVTVEPGYPPQSDAEAFGAYTTAPSPDYRRYPRRPYYPSRQDLAVPAKSSSDARPILMVPLTAYDYSRALAPWPKRLAKTLLQRDQTAVTCPSTPMQTMHNLSKIPMSPSVTIVLVPRERFSYTKRTLRSLYRKTDYPFELVVVDGNSPPRLARYLRDAAVKRNFRLIRTEHFLAPNDARNLGAKDVSSTYVVFLDNDIEVAPGWLTCLVESAEKSGAWAVAPLCFEGRPSRRIVHNAGGHIEFRQVNGTRWFEVADHLHSEPYSRVGATLQAGPTGFFEFHCVLIRLDALRTLGPLDEGYLSIQEHLDFSLLIRQAGGTIYFEPRAQVTYTFAHTFLDRFDIEYASLRWSEDWNRRSMQHFVEKWGIDESCPLSKDAETWSNQQLDYLLHRQRSVQRVVKGAIKAVMPARVYAALGAAADYLRPTAHV